MDRYVLFCKLTHPADQDIEMINTTSGATVINVASPRAMLIEAEETTVETLRTRLKDWIISPEVEHPRPGPKIYTTKEN